MSVCQKESLFGSEPVYIFGVRVALERPLKRLVRDCNATQVRDALAGDQLPVLMQVALNDKAIELMDHSLGSLVEVLQVLGRPPVGEIPVSVEFAAVVIEAVGHLMSYESAYSAVVNCVVGLGIVERRLKDAGE